jgi:hypothetical protein
MGKKEKKNTKQNKKKTDKNKTKNKTCRKLQKSTGNNENRRHEESYPTHFRVLLTSHQPKIP